MLWRPIGERYSRHIAIGLVLFVVGSADCGLSSSVEGLIGWWVVQAVDASAGVALARAMARDLYAEPRSAQTLSALVKVMAIAPLLDPIMGGQTWRWPGGKGSSPSWPASAC